MAFLRACYRSDRKLFRNRPDLTSGVYWRAPEGTPAFPGPHIFGTLNWVRGEIDKSPDLGEQLGPRPFYAGDPPPRIPLPKVCGPIEWFTRGTPAAPAAQEEQQVWGLLACCFPTAVPMVPTRLRDFDLNDPGTLYLLSTIEAATYNGDSTTAATILNAWLGPPLSLDFQPNGPGPLAGSIVARYANFSVVFISGTTNEQQWIVQILGATLGPQNAGAYSTNILYRLSSRDVHARIQAAGVPNDHPVLIVGHSYGGATAQVLGADYLLANPFRQVKVLSLGAPKAGDPRLARIADRAGFVRIENYGDPVPALPPSLYWTWLFAPVIPIAVLLAWNSWTSGGDGRQLNEDGSFASPDANAAIGVFMREFLAWLIVIAPPPPWQPHLVIEYAHRLRLAIPAGHDSFPSPASAIAVARGFYP